MSVMDVMSYVDNLSLSSTDKVRKVGLISSENKRTCGGATLVTSLIGTSNSNKLIPSKDKEITVIAKMTIVKKK